MRGVDRAKGHAEAFAEMMAKTVEVGKALIGQAVQQ
jgi:hypothetical protein